MLWEINFETIIIYFKKLSKILWDYFYFDKSKIICKHIYIGIIYLKRKMKSKTWTEKEIDILKSGFSQGKLVKTLANELGRSPTAVNKFLSRSGIRTRRWKIMKVIKAKPEELKYNKTPSLEQSKSHVSNKNNTFIDILNYLKNRGYSISRISSENNNHLSDEKYLVNNKPYSDLKMLLLANRLRTEEHKSIFSVSELIWE